MSAPVDNRPLIDGIPHPATLKDLRELCVSVRQMHLRATDSSQWVGIVVTRAGRKPIGVAWCDRVPKNRPGRPRQRATLTFTVEGGRDEALDLDDMVREFNRVREQRIRDAEWEAAGGDSA